MKTFSVPHVLRLLGCMAIFVVLSMPMSRVDAQDEAAAARGASEVQVGPLEDGRIVVPTNQVLTPAGRQVEFRGRPTDVALSPDGQTLAVLNTRSNGVLLIDLEGGAIVSETSVPGGSYAGILFTPDGRHLYVSTTGEGVLSFEVGAEGSLEPGRPIDGLGRLPVGLALSEDGTRLYVAQNLENNVAEIDLEAGSVVRTIDVGNAPFGLAVIGTTAYVSNYGGSIPDEDDTTGPAGRGIPVKVDPVRHIASEGTVSVVDLEAGTVVKEIPVGLHPSAVVASPDSRYVVVANANSDTLSVIETRTDAVVETISTRPDDRLLFGSAPNGLAFDSEGRRLFVSNGGNNAIAVVEFDPDAGSRLVGCIPTGWYPTGLVLDAERNALYVANTKGIGSRDVSWNGQRTVNGQNVFGYNSHDYRGTVSMIPIPDAEPLEAMTAEVLENNRLTESISALAPPRPDVEPRPVPQRHGEPSVFEHVVYIIKENRTYDQVFGDMPEGEGDPSLCLFGEEVTPNHHKLAREFVLLDNFYCSGTLSADGHQWTDEAYVTDYLERAYGGFPRSYPYDGGDALAYASSGFIWDNALAHDKTVRIYGEFVDASIRWKDPAREGRPGFLDCYRDFLDDNGLIEIKATAAIESIAPYICESFIGFPSVVPDIYRADEYIKELQQFEDEGAMPNLSILLLPNDHTVGTRPGYPTPAATVADNDLALGQIVDAISHSAFWETTCIFVVQDDPQAGFDHIDGHRTVAFAISPYTKRGALVSTNYNQTSMFRTIEMVLGLPPLNQFDASATPMFDCFTDTPDLTPYVAVPNQIPLDQMNPDLNAIVDPRERHWAKVSLELPLDDIDEADEDTLNRILWYFAKRDDESYPSWAITPDDDEEISDSE